MQIEQIVRAEHASRSLRGSVEARAFATCEFPREDYLWVAAATRRAEPTHRVGLRARWGRFWRSFDTPAEPEPGRKDPERSGPR
jgi:hypothetical protein